MEIDLISGDKPHSCELCSKKFALACNLRAHMKTHEGKFCEQNIFLVWATSFYYLLLINKSYNNRISSPDPDRGSCCFFSFVLEINAQ